MKRHFFNAEPVAGMRWLERLRFSLQDLSKRRIMTSFNLAAVSIAVMYFLLPAFYGLSIYRYEQEEINGSGPTRIVASCPDVNDEHLRFTDARIEQLQSNPQIKFVFPKVELGVKLSLDSHSNVDAPLEATLPEDPSLAAARLVWGRPVQTAEAREAVISEALLEKLRGVMGTNGPAPTTAFVQVSRTVAGEPQSQTIALEIVGVVAYQSFDKIYAPLGLVQQLDQWCSGKINGLGEDGDCLKLDYPHCFAYVPQGERRRLEEEADRLHLKLQPAGEVTVYDAPRDIWLSAEGDASDAAWRELTETVAVLGGAVHPVRRLIWQAAGREYVVAALAADDPRWQRTPAGRPPAFGEAFPRVDLKAAKLDSMPLKIAGTFDAPGDADLYCLPETLNWVAFDYKTSPAVTPATLLETTDFELAATWEQEQPGCTTADQPFSWVICDRRFLSHETSHDAAPKYASALPADRPADSERGNCPQPRSVTPEALDNNGPRVDPLEELIAQFRTVVPEAACDAVYEGRVRPAGVSAKQPSVRCLFIPEELFNTVAGHNMLGAQPDKKTVHCIQLDPETQHPAQSNLRIAGRRLDVVATLASSTAALLFPVADRNTICPDARKSGLAVWGDWRRERELLGFVSQSKKRLDVLHVSGPNAFSRVCTTDFDAHQRGLLEDARRCSMHDVYVLPAEARCGGRRTASLCAVPTSSKLFRGNFANLPFLLENEPTAAFSAGGPEHRFSLRPSRRLPRGLAILAEPEFRCLAFDAALARQQVEPAGKPMAAVRWPAIHFGKARQLLEQKEWRLVPLTPLSEQTLLKYKLADADQNDGRVGEDLLAVLAMTKPTFAAVVPALSIEAELGSPVLLESSDAHDPRRFGPELICGGWLTGTSANEIVLPANEARRLFPNKPWHELIAVRVDVQFRRQKQIAASEPALSLPLRIVGVTQGENALAPMELLRQLALWSEGKVVFNESKRNFEAPIAIYERRGHVRCNIHAVDLSAVEPLVAMLRKQGYRTEDSLADQQGLRRLGQALGFVVAAFAGGCLLIAAIMIVVTTMMSVHTKRWEIGILKAHGMRTGAILSIFALQGATIGVGAFLLAASLAVGLEPVLRRWIAASFKLPIETMITGSLCSPESAWLLAVALTAALALSTCGVMFPAARAAARLPVETLQRRE